MGSNATEPTEETCRVCEGEILIAPESQEGICLGCCFDVICDIMSDFAALYNQASNDDGHARPINQHRGDRQDE